MFSFEIWFSSKKTSETAMDVGVYMISIVKINTKLFFKETIDNLTDWFQPEISTLLSLYGCSRKSYLIVIKPLLK